MLKVVLATLTLVALVGSVRAETLVDRIGRKFGEAAALADLCPQLTFNDRQAKIDLAIAGLSYDDIMATAYWTYDLTHRQLDGKDQTLICLTAIGLYGENGTNAPKLLIRK